MPSRLLTKSDYLHHYECARRLYLVATGQAQLSIGEAQRMHMETGKLVDRLAQGLFPDGRSAATPGTNEDAAELTKNLLESGETCLFQATFIVDGFLVRCDILRITPEGWEVIEVKSSTSARPKDEFDLAFQWHVLKLGGYPVVAAKLIHLNKDLIYGDDQPTLEELFVTEDLTAKVKKQAKKIADTMQNALQIINAEEPQAEFLPVCKYCVMIEKCFEVRNPRDVALLPWMKPDKVRALRARGIADIDQIPEDEIGPAQLLIWRGHAHGGTYFESEIAQELERVKFPAAFIDFETINPLLRVLPGIRPGQQVPVQWSCHLALGEDMLEEDQMIHSEYLHPEATDPRPEFARTLWEAIKDAESIVYYSDFEEKRLAELARDGIPLGRELHRLIKERGVDLYTDVVKKTYLTEYNFSQSIKSVLPTLAGRYLPEEQWERLNYKEQAVKNGEEAIIQYLRMIGPGTSPDAKKQIREDLLEYCKLDSLAMVRVYQGLRKLVIQSP